MSANVKFELVANPSAKVWAAWIRDISAADWVSDDNAIMQLTSEGKLDCCRHVTAVDQDGEFLGSVVWYEYEDLAFIGFYFVVEKCRGLGVGSLIWNEMMRRIPSGMVAGMRAVPAMMDKYPSRGFTFETQKLMVQIMPISVFTAFCQSKSCDSEEGRVILVSELSAQQWQRYLAFDRAVTGRDRSVFLRLFYDLDFSEGALLESPSGEIVAAAGMVRTSEEYKKRCKIAPLYASSIGTAARLALPLLAWARARLDAENLVLLTLTGTPGEDLQRELASQAPPKLSGPTLYNAPYPNAGFQYERCFVPHNNSGHFDA